MSVDPVREGPLEGRLGDYIASTAKWRELATLPQLEAVYDDAAAARERCNALMGQVQGQIQAKKITIAQAEARDKHRFEREVDPVLRPDGQC